MFRLGWRITKVVALALALYVVVTAVQVVAASRRDNARPAEAIVVFGAAQYAGRPSPVLKARLDHAAGLYDRELAPTIWVTGGKQEGDDVTEATAAARYLIEAHGVPPDDVRREVHGRNSWDELAAVARILRREGTERVLLVSDPFHSARIKAIADELGLEAHVSPTPSSPISGSTEAQYLVRETVAVAVGRIVGFRRLAGIQDTADSVRGVVESG